MKQATLDDLIAADDPLYARVAALRLPLEALTGFQLLQDTGVQDASFFTELFAGNPVPRSGLPVIIIETFIAVRLSAFGDFFAIWGCSREGPITDDLRNRVSAFVCQRGLFLERRHPKYGTWGIRYFDYL
jgi:hypothetical protein